MGYGQAQRMGYRLVVAARRTVMQQVEGGQSCAEFAPPTAQHSAMCASPPRQTACLTMPASHLNRDDRWKCTATPVNDIAPRYTVHETLIDVVPDEQSGVQLVSLTLDESYVRDGDELPKFCRARHAAIALRAALPAPLRCALS
eukprot:3048335-Pleurochrysis_carterae.AAC.2